MKFLLVSDDEEASLSITSTGYTLSCSPRNSLHRPDCPMASVSYIRCGGSAAETMEEDVRDARCAARMEGGRRGWLKNVVAFALPLSGWFEDVIGCEVLYQPSFRSSMGYAAEMTRRVDAERRSSDWIER